MRGVLAERTTVSLESLERCRVLMNRAVPDSLVEGYESITSTLSLPDPDDRHVLAAAIHSGADLIVTFNLKDFPEAALQPHGVASIHPDSFVFQLLEDSEVQVCQIIHDQRTALKNPPKTVLEQLAIFDTIGLSQSVARMHTLKDRL